MTVTLTQPTAGYIGQGVQLFGTTDQGVAGTTAEFFISVSDFTLGLQATSAHAIQFLPNWVLLLGWDAQARSFQPPQNGLDLGHALSINVAIYQPFPTLLDSGTFAGFFHDPISGYTGLLQQLVSLSGLTPAQETLLEQAAQNSQGGTFKFPLIGLLTPVPYGGNPANGGTVYDLPPPTALQIVGISWETVTAPAYTGGDVGVITDAKRRVVQFVVFHSLFGGTTFADQIYESHAVTGSFFFDSPDPTGVALYVYPGYQVNVSYLVIL